MIVAASPESIAHAAVIIKSGGLVALPTETVYGLGGDALNPSACARIFEAKKRPFFDPLIAHISDMDMFRHLTNVHDPVVDLLAAAFWPGPLTIVVPRSDVVPDIVTSGLPTVAIRMPRHPVAHAVIEQCRGPVAAPSANPFGYLSPTEARHVEEQLGDAIDLIIDGGRCDVGVESTIVSVVNGKIYLLRPGGIPRETIESTAGPVYIPEQSAAVEAPGQLPWHYAPKTQLILIPEGEDVPAGESSALCVFRKNTRKGTFRHTEILSPSGSLTEAAANLFSALHRLDASGAEYIYAEAVPENGLGLAIMNRLKKAAAR
jgi:L-threonylcarbamoyladenylate synthase